MRIKLILSLFALCLSANAFALQQQSLLSTLTQDTSPQQALVDEYSVPQAKSSSRQQILFESYQVPDASHVNFAIPSGLYRQLCTSCLYDTQQLTCHCQNEQADEWVASKIEIKDCQQLTVDTDGKLMCLPTAKKS